MQPVESWIADEKRYVIRKVQSLCAGLNPDRVGAIRDRLDEFESLGRGYGAEDAKTSKGPLSAEEQESFNLAMRNLMSDPEVLEYFAEDQVTGNGMTNEKSVTKVEDSDLSEEDLDNDHSSDSHYRPPGARKPLKEGQNPILHKLIGKLTQLQDILVSFDLSEDVANSVLEEAKRQLSETKKMLELQQEFALGEYGRMKQMEKMNGWLQHLLRDQEEGMLKTYKRLRDIMDKESMEGPDKRQERARSGFDDALVQLLYDLEVMNESNLSAGVLCGGKSRPPTN